MAASKTGWKRRAKRASEIRREILTRKMGTLASVASNDGVDCVGRWLSLFPARLHRSRLVRCLLRMQAPKKVE